MSSHLSLSSSRRLFFPHWTSFQSKSFFFFPLFRSVFFMFFSHTIDFRASRPTHYTWPIGQNAAEYNPFHTCCLYFSNPRCRSIFQFSNFDYICVLCSPSIVNCKVQNKLCTLYNFNLIKSSASSLISGFKESPNTELYVLAVQIQYFSFIEQIHFWLSIYTYLLVDL